MASPTNVDRELRTKITQFYKDQHYTPLLDVAQHYKSFEDRPWNMWKTYKRLDRRFPDSRYILTVRDPESWWRSTERWVKIQKPHVLERYLQHFEVEEFSRDSVVEHYQKYNDDVIRYFNGTAKLLVLNLEEGDGWTQLCTFLDEPKPDLPFPHANRQAYNKTDLILKRAFRRKEKGVTCQACQKSFLISSSAQYKKVLSLFETTNQASGRWTLVKHRVSGLVRKMHQHAGFNYGSLKSTHGCASFLTNKRRTKSNFNNSIPTSGSTTSRSFPAFLIPNNRGAESITLRHSFVELRNLSSCIFHPVNHLLYHWSQINSFRS